MTVDIQYDQKSLKLYVSRYFILQPKKQWYHIKRFILTKIYKILDVRWTKQTIIQLSEILLL